MTMTDNDLIADRLFKNGTDLVKLGIQDAAMAAEKGDSRRNLTAVLNVFAGMLLLLKGRLAEESRCDGNALIYHRFKIEPREGGHVGFVPIGDKTVDFDEIRERISSLKITGIDESFWQGMRQLRAFRNKVERLFAAVDERTISANMLNVHDALSVICSSVLEDTPQKVFGDEWTLLIKQAAVAQQLRNKRDEAAGKLEWLNPRLEELFCGACCPECGFQILSVDGADLGGEALGKVFRCTSCGRGFAYDGLMEEILKAERFDDFGGRWKDEYLEPRHIGICPNCGRYGFDAEAGVCYCCGFKKKYVCAMCGEALSIDEIEANDWGTMSVDLCSRCRNNMEKDD